MKKQLVVNVSGEEIPAWAVMQVVGTQRLANDRVAMKVDKYDDDVDLNLEGSATLLVNDSTPLRITGDERYGSAIVPGAEPFWVLYRGSSVPQFGQHWGVSDDNFGLVRSSDTLPFTIMGQADTAQKRVLAIYIAESNDCPNNFRVIVTGNPTAGTFDLRLTLPGGTDSLTFNYDDTSAEFEQTIRTHSDWDSTNYSVSARDGDFPFNSISFQLGGDLAGVFIDAPLPENLDLSGGARCGVRVERACCEET